MFSEQGRLGRTVAAVALITVLSLAGPAGAEPHRASGPSRWAQWLEMLWQGGIPELARGWTVAPRTSAPGVLHEKECTPANPLGCVTNPPPGTGQGPALDPDGKPKP